MDITTITAAQEGIKALYGLVKVATSATVDHELKSRLIEIQAAILDTQAKLGDAQSERLDLLQQVAELREKVRELEAVRSLMGSYKLHQIDPGKYLYKYINAEGAGVEHYACPTCFNAGSVVVLQMAKTGAQQVCYVCKTCKFSLYIGPSDPPRRATRSDWVNGF